MLKHKVEINVSNSKGQKENVLKGGDLKLRNRFINLLLGKKQKMLVLVPSEMVESVSIKEVEEDEALQGKTQETNF